MKSLSYKVVPKRYYNVEAIEIEINYILILCTLGFSLYIIFLRSKMCHTSTPGMMVSKTSKQTGE